MQSINVKQAIANQGKISIKAALLLPATFLLAVASVTPSDARAHRDQGRPIMSSTYNPDQSRRDSSCFNVAGLPEIYACSANGG
jgi:hypothetical protein